jgi:hypothetical protein
MDDLCSCGRVIEHPARGRRRQWCVVCSPPDMRNKRAPVVQLPVRAPEESEFSLTAATRKALEDAGVIDTWQAAACLALSTLIDSAKHGASGAAGNTRAHREAMQFALADTGQDADIITAIFSER